MSEANVQLNNQERALLITISTMRRDGLYTTGRRIQARYNRDRIRSDNINGLLMKLRRLGLIKQSIDEWVLTDAGKQILDK
jgi:ribosomal protein S19E (S16A)